MGGRGGPGCRGRWSGSCPLHTELEAELAAWKGTDAALLFPTGFAANLGLLATLGGADVTILSDDSTTHRSSTAPASPAPGCACTATPTSTHLAKLLVDEDAEGRGPCWW